MRDKSFLIGMRAASAVLAVTLLATNSWAATRERVLHSFNDSGGDGQSPLGSLIFDSAGNLYGTARYGGVYDDGAVFELTPKAGGKWAERVLHSFGNGKDGVGPYANLIFDAVGNLYGTTCYGGAFGGGTVFELTPNGDGKWAEKVLHSFGNGKDGICSFANLIFDPAGNLYGTTYEGGAKGSGTVFELSPKAGGGWTEKIVHSFDDSEKDGGYPQNGLVLDADRNLYGVASETVFELTPKASGGWKEEVLHTFDANNSKRGFQPEAVIFGADGNLYGTTYTGGADGDGTVFELSPKTGGGWTEKVLHSFNGNDGVFCFAGVVFDSSGNLYGTLVEGGAYNHGTVFELTPQAGGGWRGKTLHSFDDSDGTYPWAPLVLDSAGNLYGTTESGGTTGYGTVFEITP